MPDNFEVTAMGVTDQECSDSDTCAALSATTISAGEEYVSVWLELLNAVDGDLSSFEIRDPSGDAVLSGRICEPLDQDIEQLFLRFSWTGASLTPTSGEWTAVYVRNGLDQASTTFTVAP